MVPYAAAKCVIRSRSVGEVPFSTANILMRDEKYILRKPDSSLLRLHKTHIHPPFHFRKPRTGLFNFIGSSMSGRQQSRISLDDLDPPPPYSLLPPGNDSSDEYQNPAPTASFSTRPDRPSGHAWASEIQQSREAPFSTSSISRLAEQRNEITLKNNVQHADELPHDDLPESGHTSLISAIETVFPSIVSGLRSFYSGPADPDTSLALLKKYLVEIIAFELKADIGLVSKALGGSPTASSILSDEERERLLHLSSAILRLVQKSNAGCWASASSEDRDLVVEGFSRPVLQMPLVGKWFVMDLIASYSLYVSLLVYINTCSLG